MPDFKIEIEPLTEKFILLTTLKKIKEKLKMKRGTKLILLVLGLITFALIVTFLIANAYYDPYQEDGLPPRDLVTIFTAVIVCGTLLANTFNAGASHYKLEVEKKVLVYNMIETYNSQYIRDMFKVSIVFLRAHKGLSPEAFASALNASLDDRFAVSGILNFLEKISLAYREDIGGQRLIKEYFIDIFKTNYATYADYIKVRNDIASAKGRNIFDNFLTVCKEWEKNGWII
ncbi:MAG TPA: DUF4760 domain-containing protein [Puia sp.]|nr:DUF4760 domain-containing protein [Puia sp.]